jgi:hypothetical protein
MSIGTIVDKPFLDGTIGVNVLNLLRELRKADELHHYFVITPDATLTAMGYTAGEVATIKSAYGDLFQGHQVLLGLAVQAIAANLLVNADQLAGALVT